MLCPKRHHCPGGQLAPLGACLLPPPHTDLRAAPKGTLESKLTSSKEAKIEQFHLILEDFQAQRLSHCLKFLDCFSSLISINLQGNFLIL